MLLYDLLWQHAWLKDIANETNTDNKCKWLPYVRGRLPIWIRMMNRAKHKESGNMQTCKCTERLFYSDRIYCKIISPNITALLFFRDSNGDLKVTIPEWDSATTPSARVSSSWFSPIIILSLISASPGAAIPQQSFPNLLTCYK